MIDHLLAVVYFYLRYVFEYVIMPSYYKRGGRNMEYTPEMLKRKKATDHVREVQVELEKLYLEAKDMREFESKSAKFYFTKCNFDIISPTQYANLLDYMLGKPLS